MWNGSFVTFLYCIKVVNWLKKIIIITIKTKHKNRTSKKGKGGFKKEGNLGEWKEKQNYNALDNAKR